MRRSLPYRLIHLPLGAARWSHAQAVPTASRAGIAQIGGGMVHREAGLQLQIRYQGVSIYGTYDFTRHWGIEGDIHRVSIDHSRNISERTHTYWDRALSFAISVSLPYAKALVGLRTLSSINSWTLPNTATPTKIYAFGGGVDIRANASYQRSSRRLRISAMARISTERAVSPGM